MATFVCKYLFLSENLCYLKYLLNLSGILFALVLFQRNELRYKFIKWLRLYYYHVVFTALEICNELCCKQWRNARSLNRREYVRQIHWHKQKTQFYYAYKESRKVCPVSCICRNFCYSLQLTRNCWNMIRRLRTLAV